MARVGKRAAGRMLDGIQHNAMAARFARAAAMTQHARKRLPNRRYREAFDFE